VQEIGKENPIEFSLQQNYPNQFNPTMMISYITFARSHVQMKVFDIIGREVAVLINEQVPVGHHLVTWNASSFAGSVYFC
jgi:hypothetical protein